MKEQRVATNPIGGSSSSNNNDAMALGTRESALGRDAFLQLLTTELAHQDPTKPQDDGEFIAQLAQFSSLEQLTTIQQTLAGIATALGVQSNSDSNP
jgi:flagellar basal-body rod modification protein FlgD